MTALLAVAALPAAAQSERPWMDAGLSPDARAALLEAAMTDDERLEIVRGVFAIPAFGAMPPGALGSAGYVPGVPRLGIPALQESDASLGVANPLDVRKGDRATPLPSGLATASTFDLEIAYAGGAMIGQEAWHKGFNVLLAGGANLARDPRNGRNFEYLGEDPLLAGTLAAASIRGIQDQHVISTTKHFVINDQETGRNFANAVIDEAALRESDLLAFQLAIEGGRPGAVMCSYNLINGAYACGNDHLLNDVLKGDWKYPGWVMSDWGAVHDVKDASAGLDQESGSQIDRQVFFDTPLRNALADGSIPHARLSDMARRILRSMFAVGLFDHPPVRTAIDLAANAGIARRIAEEGIVMLRNRDNALPLSPSVGRIAVIGGHADAGVLSGAGSSQVLPAGSVYLTVPVGGEGFMGAFRNMIYDPSSPLAAIRAMAPKAEVRFDDGRYAGSATALAKWADVVIVFGTQWMIEGDDAPDLSLPDGQDALIAAVAAANPRTVVVLETGGPVAMPWLTQTAAVVEAWYPGARGGEAIAAILFGTINPSGHLPLTFPRNMEQNPRPAIPGLGLPPGHVFDVPYTEGSAVGYRWFAAKDETPLFPFGFGLSYTDFTYANLTVTGGSSVTVGFDVTNAGSLAGAAVPQIYLTTMPGGGELRLIGFSRVTLAPGETKHVSVTADPRLLAHFDSAAHGWRIEAGTYRIVVGRFAGDRTLGGSAQIHGALLPP
jgi:beta-glucosidase